MRGTRFIAGTAAVCAVTILAACQDDTLTNAGPDGAFDAPQLSQSGGDEALADAFSAMLDDLNVALAGEGAAYRAVMVEYVTGAGDEAGATVISKDVGNKQLAFDFVPFDVRRAGWSGSVAGPDDDITYAVDRTGDAVPPLGVLNGTQTTDAIRAAMATWEAQTCSSIPITEVLTNLNLGVLQANNLVADIMHGGWGNFFGGGVLGATFTFGFCAPCSPTVVFTDIDNNGKLDAAFREIYYDAFISLGPPTPWPWNVDGSGIDVEAVALHEAGHGLSQAHFGNIFFKNDGSVKRAPAAVMNPFILGATRTLLGTDNGGHCSNWAQWPNN